MIRPQGGPDDANQVERCGLDRRSFLGGTAAVGAMALSERAMGNPAGKTAPNPRRIDVHHHFNTPQFVEKTRDIFMNEIKGMAGVGRNLDWTAAESIAEMDKAGVATAMLSVNLPGPWPADRQVANALAQHCNEFAADLVKQNPGRFGNLACLPMPNVDDSLKEVARAFDRLNADGICLQTSYQDKWLGDQSFWPLYEELNRRKAVVFVHPVTPNCCKGMHMEAPVALLEFPFDTTRAITNLIYSGAALRFPDIRFIFSHGGGSTLMILDRLSVIAMVKPELADRIPQGVDHFLKSYFYDTASVYNPAAFAAMRAALPLSQILYGTDVPYGPIGPSVEKMARLVPDAEALHAIERTNALALFPQFA